MYVASVAAKLNEVLQAQGSVEHADLLPSLEHHERVGLLDTARELERIGVLKRDVSEIRDGKLVLKYVFIPPASPAPPTAAGGVTNANSA